MRTKKEHKRKPGLARRAGATLVAAPVSVPTRDRAGGEHGATEAAPIAKCAKGPGAFATGAADGQAAHGRRSDANMIVSSATKPDAPARAAKQVHQRPHGGVAGSVGTRVAASTAIVALSRRDPSETDARTFLAPDRTVTIGDERWRAKKYQPRGDDAHCAIPYPKAAPTIIAAINAQ